MYFPCLTGYSMVETLWLLVDDIVWPMGHHSRLRGEVPNENHYISRGWQKKSKILTFHITRKNMGRRRQCFTWWWEPKWNDFFCFVFSAIITAKPYRWKILGVTYSVRPNVRFGSVSSAEPLVRWGSVVRQNQWFGEPNRIPNQKG